MRISNFLQRTSFFPCLGRSFVLVVPLSFFSPLLCSFAHFYLLFKGRSKNSKVVFNMSDFVCPHHREFASRFFDSSSDSEWDSEDSYYDYEYDTDEDEDSDSDFFYSFHTHPPQKQAKPKEPGLLQFPFAFSVAYLASFVSLLFSADESRRTRTSCASTTIGKHRHIFESRLGCSVEQRSTDTILRVGNGYWGSSWGEL